MKCRFEHDGDCCNSGATQYMCKCKQPCDTIMPITNADRIRSMSDEELSILLCSGMGCEQIPQKVCETYTRCTECTLAWLKQPAKENDP